MITVISGTNRKGSNTRKVAQHLFNELVKKDSIAQFVSLEDFPFHTLTPDMYDEKHTEVLNFHNNYLKETKKYILVVPEYNGSFPGALKMMLDAVDIKEAFWHKKVALVGVSSGRAGNLRGLDTLTNMCNYMKMDVLHNKVPLSSIEKELDENGTMKNEGTVRVLQSLLDEFVNF